MQSIKWGSETMEVLFFNITDSLANDNETDEFDIDNEYLSPDGIYSYRHEVYPQSRLWYGSLGLANGENIGYPVLNHEFNFTEGYSIQNITADFACGAHEFFVSEYNLVEISDY